MLTIWQYFCEQTARIGVLQGLANLPYVGIFFSAKTNDNFN